jgi:HSP20 family protein
MDNFERLLQEMFGFNTNFKFDNFVWKPRINIEETKDNLKLTTDLPGVKKEDIELEVEDGYLSIRGQRPCPDLKKEKIHYIRLERECGPFERVISVPEGVDSKDISASFSNGVLEVLIKKPTTAQKTISKVNIQ